MMEDLNRDDDERLVQRVRKLDPERFTTLCRMHLSFLLDLTSNDLNSISEFKIKSKTKFSFTASLQRKVKNDVSNILLKRHEMNALYELMEFISQPSSIRHEGIFRKTGNLTRQKELYRLIKSGESLHLDCGSYSAHDCANVLKGYFSDLPAPLLTDNHFDIHCQIASLYKETLPVKLLATTRSRQIQALKFVLLLLPSSNRSLLRALLILLNRVCHAQHINLMNSVNLATMFAPHILCPRKLSPEELREKSNIATTAVALMIEKAVDIFEPPTSLVADLKVYWENKFTVDKSTGSPLQVSDPEAVQTVVTFCDRQTGSENDSDYNTAVALAELYSHIHSMPESSKKKQLIKKLNKKCISSPMQARLTSHRSSSQRKSTKKLGFGISDENKLDEGEDIYTKVKQPSYDEVDTIRHPVYFPDKSAKKFKSTGSLPYKQENALSTSRHSLSSQYLSLASNFKVACKSVFLFSDGHDSKNEDMVNLTSYTLVRSASECSLRHNGDILPISMRQSFSVDFVRNVNRHVQIYRETAV